MYISLPQITKDSHGKHGRDISDCIIIIYIITNTYYVYSEFSVHILWELPISFWQCDLKHPADFIGDAGQDEDNQLTRT